MTQSVHASTITAPTCNQADVQNVINWAVDGDTVMVPAGSCSWTTKLVINKAVWLKASGTVTITDDDTKAETLMMLVESPAGHVRLSGFTFNAGAGPNSEYGDAIVGLFPTSNGKPIPK